MAITATTRRSEHRTLSAGGHRRNGHPSDRNAAPIAAESYDDWRRDAFSRIPLGGSPLPGWLPAPSATDYDW
jgi:hypothetical protein